MTHVIEPLSRCTEAAVYYEEWVSRSMKFVVQCYEKAREEVRSMFGAGVNVDEVAIMFRDPDALRHWVEAAVRVPGVTLFNTAHDRVVTSPIPGQYDVHYWFLTVPEEYGGWRIEAMYAHPGSPLHDSLLRRMLDQEALVVHASFKCADEEEYGSANSVLARNGYALAQRCDSTYGRFSYWRLDEEEYTVFLKPRVNLRDAGGDDE